MMSPRALLPSPDRQFVGLDIGGTKCAVACWDGANVRETLRIPTGEFTSTYATLREEIDRLRNAQPVVIGVSCGGPLNRTTGVITCPPNLDSSWHGEPICQRLQDDFGGQATLMNDANACALAEWHFGAGRGTQHFIFLTSGTGFGAGLILNGELYEGATGDAGEIGHVRLAPDGPVGFGKAGSVEGFCSGGGIARLAEMRRDHAPSTWREDSAPITAARLAVAANNGDPWAIGIFAEAGKRLGEAVAVLIDLFNPECIALGGFFPKSRHLLEPSMTPALKSEALEPAVAACRVVPAQLGDSIGSHGAIAAAWHSSISA